MALTGALLGGDTITLTVPLRPAETALTGTLAAEAAEAAMVVMEATGREDTVADMAAALAGGT